jgi:phage tail tape-measure protein
MTTAWESTKKWVDENRVVSGAVAGLAAGSVVPGVGNVVGAIVGAGVGWWSTKEKEKREGQP